MLGREGGHAPVLAGYDYHLAMITTITIGAAALPTRDAEWVMPRAKPRLAAGHFPGVALSHFSTTVCACLGLYSERLAVHKAL